MIVIDCEVCKTDFSMTNHNTTRHLYMEEKHLQWVSTRCPNCQRKYSLFTDHASDNILAESGVSYTMERTPPIELHERFNETFYPDLDHEDEEEISRFIDQLARL